FLDDQAARVGTEAPRVPAERAAAGQACEALHGATHVRALDLLAHELIVDPAPAVAHDFVPGLDDGGGGVRGSLERHGHGEYADLDAVLGEDAHEAPESRAGPVLVHRLDLKVAHALQDRHAHDFLQARLGLAVAVQDRSLAAFFVVHHDLERETGAVAEGAEAAQDVLPLRGASHGADAPDLPLGWPERGADLDVEVLDEPAANAQLVDAFRHDHGGDERQPPLRRLLAEEGEAERVDAGAQRVAVQTMAGEAGREPFFAHRAQRLAQAVHHRGRGGVMVEAGRAPVVRELAEVEIVAADPGPAFSDDALGPRVERHRRQPRGAAQALLGAGGRDVEGPPGD